LKKIILVTGKDCHLCDQAKKILLGLDKNKLNFAEEDVYAKREYLDAYWDKIPVILYKDRVLLWPFTAENVTEFIL
tara:strand:- start:50 stop:277 length:228 start_codon:yes stop_codon:yes gene_type:complete